MIVKILRKRECNYEIYFGIQCHLTCINILLEALEAIMDRLPEVKVGCKDG